MTADVKLLASERLTDLPDGGGLMTSTVIEDGVVNNVWPDVSRVDRTYGVVNLRKLFVKADTADTAIYSGLHVICLMPPQDPRVSVTMFSTNNWADERADAQSAMERYLDVSVRTPMVPFDRQLEGSRALLVFQRPEVDLPNIGEVYVISEIPAETTQQFVRVTNIEHSVQMFSDPSSNRDFPARVITLTLSEPLTHTYQGSQPSLTFNAGASTSIVRKSVVSDAVSYHTVHQLAEDVAADALSVKLDSVYAQLLPATTAEAPLVDTPPGGSVAVITSATAERTFHPVGTINVNNYAGTAITPGSVYLVRPIIGSGTICIDDFAGNLRSGTSLTGTIVGSVNYAAGMVVFTDTFGGNLAADNDVHYTPAAAVSKVSQTLQLPVSQSTRGYVYVATLRPIPAPGNLKVSYRALGRWYDLEDDGSGAITGETSVGTGSINFATGSVSVSLGALPDIGSSIIFAWGGGSEYEIRVSDLTVDNPTVTGTLTGGNCEPGTMTVTWEAGGVGKTATDDGAGNFTGDATGRLVYGNGTFALKPTLLPDPTTTFAFAYQNATVQSEIFNPSKSGSTVTCTVANAPVRQKSVLITYFETIGTVLGNRNISNQLYDDGAGNIINAIGNIFGSINYTTGAIVWDPDFSFGVPVATYEQFSQYGPGGGLDPSYGYYAPVPIPSKWPTSVTVLSNYLLPFTNGNAVTIQYKEDSATDTAQTYNLAAPSLRIDLTPSVTSTVVEGGVVFTLGGRTYMDRAGSLYYGVSSATNAGTLGGSIDYTSGIAMITSWVGGASHTLSLLALLTQADALPITLITGRVPGQTLRPASFYIQANQLDGTLISTTADVDGNIATSAMHGYVDVTTGVFQVAFGAYVLDSSLTSDEKLEPWYDSGNVDGSGYIFRPKPVLPNSITYNAVVQTSLPLDSTILGINPVRLPLDGRVQAVRPANMLILHDTQAYTMPSGLTAGQVVTLPRDALALVEVRDQDGYLIIGQTTDGDPVTGAFYTADLAAGTITMSTPLDLSDRGDTNPAVEPLVATHRIEDSVLITDVQITGEVSFAQPLAHAYTAANSLASTALIAPFVGGSVQAVYTHLFSQQTWNSASPNWTDAIVGSGTTAAFNDLDYPIEVLDRDAITENWALVFTNSTTFNIVGQDLGVIGTGTTSADVMPINPGTGNPYFRIDHLGFGIGWANGNAIRFDTQGAGMPIWLARTVKSGPATYVNDHNVIEPRWDKS